MTTELYKALVKAQLEIKQPKKEGKNPMFKEFKYVTLDAILDSIRHPLANNGLCIYHDVETADGKSVMHTTLQHVSGEKVTIRMPMFVEKVTSQGFGSACTYSKRYSICSLLCLSSDEDDDGNEAVKQQIEAPKAFLSDDQVEEIDQLIGDNMELLNRMLNGYKVDKLKSIENKHFGSIVKSLKARKTK